MFDFNSAFEDFVDQCLLEDDSLCNYEEKDLDNALARLVAFDRDEF